MAKHENSKLRDFLIFCYKCLDEKIEIRRKSLNFEFTCSAIFEAFSPWNKKLMIQLKLTKNE
jgi:hypothetical protein